MASELREKTQKAIDALREANSTCSLAMLVDGDTGLVLCKSSDAVVPQNELDELASGAQQQRGNALHSAMIDTTTDASLFSWTQVTKESITTAITSVGSGDETLICQFESAPDRPTLHKSASAVFDLSSDAEAS